MYILLALKSESLDEINKCKHIGPHSRCGATQWKQIVSAVRTRWMAHLQVNVSERPLHGGSTYTALLGQTSVLVLLCLCVFSLSHSRWLVFACFVPEIIRISGSHLGYYRNPGPYRDPSSSCGTKHFPRLRLWVLACASSNLVHS